MPLRSEYSLEERSDIEGRGGIDDDEGVARAESEEGPMESLHYQNVQGGEVRNHGVGYFAFSTDTEKRKEQMELLDNLREKVRKMEWHFLGGGCFSLDLHLYMCSISI